MLSQWRRITYDSRGYANTIFLKATLPDATEKGQRIFAGLAIWVQLSMVEGRGERPSDDLRSDLDLNALYPGNYTEQRYLCQVYRSFAKRRVEVVKEKAVSQSPALMHLQLCVVDPSYQRMGIASRLVQWGLDEAQRRGGLEAITEASSSKYKFIFAEIVSLALISGSFFISCLLQLNVWPGPKELSPPFRPIMFLLIHFFSG